MHREKEKITVKYQTKRIFCRCCDRELEDPAISDIREFDFYLQDLKNDNDWVLFDEVEELPDVVEEYVYNTVIFFAVSHDDGIIFLDGEVDRILDYIKTNLLKK